MDYSSDHLTLVCISITWKGPDSEIIIQYVWVKTRIYFQQGS